MDASLDGDQGVAIATPEVVEAPPRESAGRRLSTFLHRHPRAAARPAADAAALVAAARVPRLAGRAVRGGVLAARPVHGRGRPRLRLPELQAALGERRLPAITQRTVLIAAAVTVTDAVLAFPIAFYMAKVASPRTRNLLVVAILLPLWASYLVKVYAWRIILQEEGILNWALEPFGLSGPGFGNVATWLVFSLSLAAVHDPAGLRGTRADPVVAARGVRRSRRARRPDAPARRLPARPAGDRGRLDLHLLADARRLHHAAARLEHAVHRQRRLHQRRRREQPPVRGRVRDRAGRGDGRLPAARAAPRERSRTCDVSRPEPGSCAARRR